MQRLKTETLKLRNVNGNGNKGNLKCVTQNGDY